MKREFSLTKVMQWGSLNKKWWWIWLRELQNELQKYKRNWFYFKTWRLIWWVVKLFELDPWSLLLSEGGASQPLNGSTTYLYILWEVLPEWNLYDLNDPWLNRGYISSWSRRVMIPWSYTSVVLFLFFWFFN